MMEDFDDNAGDDDDDDDEGDEDDDDDGDLSSSSQPAGFAGTNNPAANLSLSASGSLAARRSLHNNGNFSPSPSPGSRYGDMSSVSEPIAMSIAAHAPIAGGSAAAGGAGAAGVAALEEARTPMNQHFLSTLAESSPGGPAFFSAAAARAAVSAAAAAAVARNGPGIIAAPNAETNGNGHRSSHPASPLGLELADEELDVDRSTPSAGGGGVGGAASPLAGPKRGAHDALGGRDSGRRSSSSGVGPAGNVDATDGPFFILTALTHPPFRRVRYHLFGPLQYGLLRFPPDQLEPRYWPTFPSKKPAGNPLTNPGISLVTAASAPLITKVPSGLYTFQPPPPQLVVCRFRSV
ncbi:unnamed protein product [Tilletia laevis]|uniref:Uncharacterized protein n=1 Tax=Tilletia laevis TaxID=157183 RepID=A0A9N8QF32_9BASI|nr:unnamed protein product [Tilletia laevis]